MHFFIYIFLLSFSQAEAKLGDHHSQLQLRKMNQTQSSSLYTTSTSQLEDAIITEYLNSSRQVFAVTWVGTFHPDESKIFGASYLDNYNQNEKLAHIRGQRNSLQIKNSNLVVKKSGHMGDLRGKAYDPNLVPNGLDINEIK
jgi:hypothetical protein